MKERVAKMEAVLTGRLLGKKTNIAALSNFYVALMDYMTSEKKLRLRHLINTEPYEEEGSFEKWGWSVEAAKSQALVLLQSEVLPKPKNGEKVIIFSPSANASATESILQDVLGNSYEVVSGDLADVVRVDKTTRPIRADASFIPFANNSIDVVYDNLGAMWYEAHQSESEKTTTHIENLFKEYGRVLRENGMVVVDGSTAHLIDNAMIGRNGIEGFFYRDFHNLNNLSLRVYYKIPELTDEFFSKVKSGVTLVNK